MQNRLVQWIATLIAFAGVGYFVLDNQVRTAFRNAEGARDACYAANGIPLDPRGGPLPGAEIPDSIVDLCTQSMVENQSAMGPYVIGLLAALAAAAIVFGIFQLLRRKASPTAAE